MTDYSALPARELDALVAREVLGLDLTANSDERIARAVTSGMRSSHGDGYADFKWAGQEFRRVRLVGTYGVGARGNAAYGLSIWRERHGKPWQSAIEQAVSDWSASPAHYSTDGRAMLAVLDALRGRGMGPVIYCGGKDFTVNVGHSLDGVDVWGSADTLPRAVAEAALAAVGGK